MTKQKIRKQKVKKKKAIKSVVEKISARQKVRSYLDNSKGNEQNIGHLSIDSLEPLYEGQIYPFVIALVPAHNEENRISNTIDSLLQQSRPPDEIIVIADNCTDNTVILSLAKGVNVFKQKTIQI